MGSFDKRITELTEGNNKMRTNELWFSVWSGVRTLGIVTVAALAGCGQLWRPFLESSDCPDNPAACPSPILNDGGANPTPTDFAVPYFRVEPSGMTQNLYGIWGTNSEDSNDQNILHTPIWAVGAFGTVLRRNSQVGVWKQEALIPTISTLYAVTGHSEYDVLVVGDMQVSVAWNGMSWTVNQPSDMAVPPPFLSVSSVSPLSYLAVGRSSSASIITSQNRTIASFSTKIATTDLTSVYTSPSGGTSYIGAANGEIYKTAGSDASPYGLKSGGGINAIWLRSATDGWAVGDSGLILHYDGSSWVLVMMPQIAALPTLRGVYGNSMGQVWVVGDIGTILYFDGTWQMQQTADRTNLHGVWVDSATGGAWIVGDSGLILHAGPATR